jgi:pantoate--beta-alanine ligase
MQCIVIKTMVTNLNFPLEVVIHPTVREADGLAMSSRNTYLSPQEREIAPTVYQALKKAAEHLKVDRKAASLISVAKGVIDSRPELKLDYFNLCDLESGYDVDRVEDHGAMLSTAVFLGKTRLIDNIILKP